MPLQYVLIHLVLTGMSMACAARLGAGSTASRGFGVGLLLAVMGGMVLERRAEWAWDAMRLSWPDLVFFTNLSLEGVVALLVLLWRQAGDTPARARAGVLGAVALGAALWSYAWLFLPTPDGLAGAVDATGLCRQTSDDSCSAAAAVMVLHHHGIPATEAEMARLCLTRAQLGTPSLGLHRGLALKAGPHRRRPRLLHLRGAADFSRLAGPAVIRVGLRRGAPPEVTKRMQGYGWTPGVFHAVVVLAGDPGGKWIEVADPSYGREKWPIRDPLELAYIWDGRALILEPSG